MRKLAINIDADDTIWDLLCGWISAINKEHDTHFAPDDITSWDIAAFFPQLTKGQVFAPIKTEKLWKDIQPIRGSIEALSRLLDDGHDLHIVTASHYHGIEHKAEALLKLFPFFSWDNIIITSKKQLVKCDILIDDAPHNLIGGEYMKFLFDRPHNRKFDEKEHGIKRVFTWDEIYDEVGKIAKD